MNDDTSWVWYVLVIVVMFGIVAAQEVNGKKKVKTLLEEKGFRNIKVTTTMLAGGRGTLTFEVEYYDKDGVLQQNACVIHSSIFSDGKIYWEKPLD